MVRVGDFELRLVRKDTRVACPEVMTPDGRTYAVAAPGAPFNVSVSRHVNPVDPYSVLTTHNVDLKMDGRSVGYTYNLDALHPTASFPGFLQHGDALGCTYSTFVFAQPVEDAAAAAQQPPGQGLEAGTVKAMIWQAVSQVDMGLQSSLGPVNTSTAVPKLPEGKKFFTAPSLVTGTGAPVSGPGLTSSSVQRFGQPTTIDLCYETASTLMLRRVLRPEIPDHHAILQMFPETASKEEEEEEAEASGVNGGEEDEEGGAGGSRKRRQQQQQQQAGQRQRAQVVDLTRAPAPNDEIIAANRAGKELVCDLCDDDEQPQWHAVKKPVHHVG